MEEAGPLTGAEAPPRPIRAFFGLPLPDAHRRALGAHIAEYAKQAAGFRWVSVQTLHLTVRFIGWTDRHLAVGIAEQVAARSLPAPQLALGEFGTFKRGRLARVVWIGLSAGVEATTELAAVVEAECVRAGLEPETRPLAPHLTLARSRSRDGAPPPSLGSMPSLEPWRAEELILYESHLTRDGAEYEPLVRIPLGG